jgi:hypothetical protein
MELLQRLVINNPWELMKIKIPDGKAPICAAIDTLKIAQQYSISSGLLNV